LSSAAGLDSTWNSALIENFDGEFWYLCSLTLVGEIFARHGHLKLLQAIFQDS
jgi:hypothetical protein